ncbi:MAG TPA: cytochrome c [Gemmatimonadales bacterium]|nr:cytochrome c [Gemmatimonadales bacterium]
MLKVAAALIAGFVAMGGWAVVTVKDLPEYFVAGQHYTIEFEVRQHGRTLLSGLRPQLIIDSPGAREVVIAAVPRSTEGTYAVTFTAPAPPSPAAGEVRITIRSGFMNNELRLYPQPVIAAGTSRPAMAARDRGQMLFVAKGCNTCHSNIDLADRPANQLVTVGPELGGRHLAREFVIQKVKNPASKIMPDLGLSDVEASAIAAFLNGERGALSDR